MKTYEEDIFEHIAGVLAKMPYSEPKALIAAKRTPALEILKFYLRKHGISLNNENKLKSKEGHTLGQHISADWVEQSIIWIYEFQGQYVTQILRVGET